jgi:GntR family transcriptional regulator
MPIMVTWSESEGRNNSNSRTRRRSDDARRIRDLLREDLKTFVGSGGILLDERLLSKRLAASRNAVREALNLLREEGLVERRQGSGTKIVWLPVVIVGLGGIPDSIDDPGRVSYETLWCYQTPATEYIAGHLGLEAGTMVAVVERLTYVDGTPIGLWTNYFRVADGLRIADEEDGRSATIPLLSRALGVKLQRLDRHVEAVMTDESVATILNVPENRPLMRIRRTLVDVHGITVSIGFGRMRGIALDLSIE